MRKNSLRKYGSLEKVKMVDKIDLLISDPPEIPDNTSWLLMTEKEDIQGILITGWEMNNGKKVQLSAEKVKELILRASPSI